MRSILSFIWKKNFIFLFLFLELISFILVVQNNGFQRAGFVSSSNFIAANIYQKYNNITGYFGLQKTNEALAEENTRLHAQSVLSFSKYVNKEFVYNDTIFKQRYTYLNAGVINNSIYHRNNYLTLNKGIQQGVEPEMGVISSNGVVGIVKDVSDNFSTVLSILHKNSSISAKIAGKDYFGSLIWDGKDFKYGVLKDIPSHVKIKNGARILTSGYSAIFPEGVLIGIIDGFELIPGDNSYTITVKFSEDYSNLSLVYVVRNLLKNEQDSIETNVLNE